MDQIIREAFIDSADIKRKFAEANESKIEEVVGEIVEAFKRGNKLLLFGNGGSAADCQHIAAEFVNRFKIERPPLPAIALTTDTSIITSIGNDYDFSDIFAKQIKALAAEGDIVIAISTSGNSPNVLKGMEAGKKLDLLTILFSGGNGGKALELSDYTFLVPSGDTPRIQEVHITLAHVLCEMVDFKLFKGA
ncbi:MAG: D-sedoheptulose 7-phosphate isomerase [Deltaproteobacteria bacterium]|uniref:Phosphoheptose isomerase n=1 Tax=Candidatus Zymogenus saltonus TaxID=2844893 RepID=A0A9D8KCP9_9DELT|nr:D-sedoheptulose 7-phosphate isomerase [Candidatus Zymogenus saltonus]